MMTHMAFSAKTETTLMRELTEKTTRDADAVKWLTFLTLIYLPASFVAVSRFEVADYIIGNSVTNSEI